MPYKLQVGDRLECRYNREFRFYKTIDRVSRANAYAGKVQFNRLLDLFDNVVEHNGGDLWTFKKV